MVAPKSLVYQLHKNWELIETLGRHSRELIGFSSDLLLQLAERYSPQESPSDILQSLIKSNILQQVGRSDNLQLNPLVLEFVRGLTREHELGLSSVLKARIDAISDASNLIETGIEEKNIDNLRKGAANLYEITRQILLQLDQDNHAILEIVEKAKAQDASYSLAKRYKDVLAAYDQYVEPMNEMMDIGPSGTFYPYLARATNSLDKAEEYLAIIGGLSSHRAQLRTVGQQVRELDRKGRIVAQQAADSILPLRDEIRRYSNLSTAITELLGRVRKRGLKFALDSSNTPLPAWQTSHAPRVYLGNGIREVVAQAKNFEPSSEAFPEDITPDSSDFTVIINEQELRKKLLQDLPIDNLLVWLQSNYGEISDSDHLRLYHEITQEKAWQVSLDAKEQSTELKDIRVIYKPHSLVSLLQEEGADGH